MNQSTIKFLPACHGDAFIIHCYKGDEEGYIIVDGGPLKKPIFNPFLKEVENISHIDLIVLTHQDDDHLVGIKEYVKKHKADNPFPVDRMWINSARFIDMPSNGNLSAMKANTMVSTLRSLENQKLRWTDKIVNHYDTSEIKYADIDIINPCPELLALFFDRYEKLLNEKCAEPAINLSGSKRSNEDLEIDLSELAKRKKVKPNLNNYQHLANIVSISFILRCDGLSILMLGDSFPITIEHALRERGYSEKDKLEVDFVKISHHGSRYNISNSLLDIIDCQNFLIPTNGGCKLSYHPDREALANILCHNERDIEKPIHLYFNYPLKKIEERVGKLFKDDETLKYNFIIHQEEYELPTNVN